jgi:class 3 adenylate cyclase
VSVCPNCGRENPADARFCNGCGSPLAETPPLVEERKIVTVLFVDLVGFTSRAERLDPEDVRAIQAPYFARVREAIEAFGGVVEKYIGDAVMAVFGAPVTHGDDPERAVRAALAILQSVEDLELRIAVNTGEALVSVAANPAQSEGLVSGDVVNTASRLQTAAPVNRVLVGEQTYLATRGAIEYEEVEPVVAKGKQEPVRAWLAVAASAAPGERPAGRAPLVGRSSELGLLESTWSRVVSERRPQLVTLFGPAGIGKSRLAAEFGALARQDGARVIRGRSVPYGEMTTYGALASQVKQIAGIFDTDGAEAALTKLRDAVAALVHEEPHEVSSHVAMLIGVGHDDGVSDRQALFFSARRLVEALAREHPTVLIFEDIHWADAGMLDLLEVLASRVRDVPLLLLALARPELRELRPTWGGGLPGYTAVPLEHLSEEHAHELAVHLLPADSDPQAIAQAAEGNPLFIEELSAGVTEVATTSGLPGTIRAIVTARLDALPPEERVTLLDAAVIGKVFWRGALERMGAGKLPLAELLDSLEGRDLIRRESVSRLSGDQQFSFKHDLIREVAYATLPRPQRKKRHAQVAEFLGETTGEIPAAASALAQHWREAGENERAVEQLVVAGDQANRGWAKEQAAEYYQEALVLIPEDDRTLRREVAKKYAVAAQASLHVPEVLSQRGALRSAGSPPE